MPREGFITRREAESTYKRSESQIRRDVWAAHDRRDFDFLSHFYVELADETTIDGRDATKEKMDEVKRQRPIWCVRETFMASAYWKRDKPKGRGVPEAEVVGDEHVSSGRTDVRDDYNDLPPNIRRLLIEKDARLEDALRRETEARDDKETQNNMFEAMLAEIIGVEKLLQIKAKMSNSPSTESAMDMKLNDNDLGEGIEPERPQPTVVDKFVGLQGDDKIREVGPRSSDDEPFWSKNRPLRDLVAGPARFVSSYFRRIGK